MMHNRAARVAFVAFRHVVAVLILVEVLRIFTNFSWTKEGLGRSDFIVKQGRLMGATRGSAESKPSNAAHLAIITCHCWLVCNHWVEMIHQVVHCQTPFASLKPSSNPPPSLQGLQSSRSQANRDGRLDMQTHLQHLHLQSPVP